MSTLLLVEDDPGVAEALRLALTSLGHQVELACPRQLGDQVLADEACGAGDEDTLHHGRTRFWDSSPTDRVGLGLAAGRSEHGTILSLIRGRPRVRSSNRRRA